MSRHSSRYVALVVTLLAAGQLSAQSTDNQLIRREVSQFYASTMFGKLKIYVGKQVVFDSARLAAVFDRDHTLLPDTRAAVSYSATDQAAVASSAHLPLGSPDDVIHCTHAFYGCAPANHASYQISEPLIVGDSAYVVVRILIVDSAGPRTIGSAHLVQHVVTLYHYTAGWFPTTIRAADRPENVGKGIVATSFTDH